MASFLLALELMDGSPLPGPCPAVVGLPPPDLCMVMMPILPPFVSPDLEVPPAGSRRSVFGSNDHGRGCQALSDTWSGHPALHGLSVMTMSFPP